jgi:hypothetical protein
MDDGQWQHAYRVAGLHKYERRRLVAHLVDSGRMADLHRLRALETGQERNAWPEASEAIDTRDHQ